MRRIFSRASLTDPSRAARPMCYVCYRPCSHCLCKFISPFEAHCNILILQHPHERRKYYSTARLVALTLTNAKLLCGLEFKLEIIEKALTGQNAYLLYPSRDAEDCETVPLGTSSTVIVVDGTWDEAGKIVYRNPMLKQLPALTFKKQLRSNYRIRKQPKENYLSTIESVGYLLKLNALATRQDIRYESYDTLFHIFTQMVDQQIRYFPRMRELGSDILGGSRAEISYCP